MTDDKIDTIIMSNEDEFRKFLDEHGTPEIRESINNQTIVHKKTFEAVKDLLIVLAGQIDGPDEFKRMLLNQFMLNVGMNLWINAIAELVQKGIEKRSVDELMDNMKDLLKNAMEDRKDEEGKK